MLKVPSQDIAYPAHLVADRLNLELQAVHVARDGMVFLKGSIDWKFVVAAVDRRPLLQYVESCLHSIVQQRHS